MIKIICVGKLKEKFLKEACHEYIKRIRKYHKFEIIELDDNNTERSLEIERDNILNKIKKNEYIITLDINGQQVDTLELSTLIDKTLINYPTITFIIGGSNGIHQDIKSISNIKLSFSKLTFPHQLFRVLLLEQIYRSFKIIKNETYHK